MSWEVLHGKTIESVWADKGGYYIKFVTTEGEEFTWMAVGDCCAHAFVNSYEGINDLFGSEVTKVVVSGVTTVTTDDIGDYDVVDTEWIRFHNKWGESLVLELRTEHNGYYGGWLEPATKEPDVEMLCVGPTEE